MFFLVAAFVFLRFQKKGGVLFFRRRKKIEELLAEKIEWHYLVDDMYVGKVAGKECTLQLNDLEFFPEAPAYTLFYRKKSLSLEALPMCWALPEESFASSQDDNDAGFFAFLESSGTWREGIDSLMLEGLDAFVNFLKEENIHQETFSFFETAMSQIVYLLQIEKQQNELEGTVVSNAISNVKSKPGDPLSKLEGLFAMLLNEYKSQRVDSPVAAAQWFSGLALIHAFQSPKDAKGFCSNALQLDPSNRVASRLQRWLIDEAL